VREDSWDATGARTFLSAATLNESRAFKGPDPVEDSRVAADKNVRAPLWFRLRRPGNTAPYLIENCCWRPVAHCARRILCVSLLVIMYRDKRVVVVMPAYNAARTLRKTH